jgi:hypothetical protein
LLDLHQHPVEVFDQGADLVAAGGRGAEGEIAFGRHHPGRVRQVEDGRRDPALQPGGDDERQQPAAGQNREHDQPEQPHAPGEFVQARPDVDRPEQIAVEHDASRDDQRTRLEADAGGGRSGWRGQPGMAGGVIGREQLPISM